MAAYRLETEIGRGALGRVVRVVDGQSGQVFAGKLLHDSFRDDPRAVKRFSAEARLLASLAHENIVRVHELAVIDGREVILMELVEGPSLQSVLAAGRNPARAAGDPRSPGASPGACRPRTTSGWSTGT